MIREAYMEYPADARPHIELPPVPEDGRVIVIGDVHGCLDELLALLQECSYNKEKDKVVIVGDLVNKGPKSLEVLRYVRDEGIISIKGNHDDWVLQFYYGKRPKDPSSWDYHMTEEDAKYLLYLPFTINIPQFNAIVVHAGIVPGIPLHQQHHGTMYRIRNLLETTKEYGKLVNEIVKDNPGLQSGLAPSMCFLDMMQYENSNNIHTPLALTLAVVTAFI